MNYNKDSDLIRDEILDNIPNNYEKRQGSYLWDIIKGIAIRIKGILAKLTHLASLLNVDNLTGSDLERFIEQRTGINRKQATHSECILHIVGNGVINQNDLFVTEGYIKFKSTETKNIIGEDTITVTSVDGGSHTNIPANTVISIPVTIQGISNCYNLEPSTGGYDAETDDDLRERYYERLREPATSGNIYHYKLWAKEVEGVGNARCIPIWQGHNTVKVILINSDRLPADEQLVEDVQNYIDPNITGEGQGEAPIGAKCTVVSANPFEVNIAVKVYKLSTINTDIVLYDIEQIITDYLKDIAFNTNILSYAIVGSKILDVAGVIDYTDFTLNDMDSNLLCTDDDVFVLGTVTLL